MRKMIHYIAILNLLAGWVIVPAFGVEPALRASGREERSSVTLFFVGDVMQHLPQVEAAWDLATGRHDYAPCFRYIRPLWQQMDFVVANLETTLADRGYRGYPCFVSPRSLAEGLAEAGVNVVATANNHCCDNGKRGLQQTLTILDSIGVAHTGTALTHTPPPPVWLLKGPFRIALLNYTYGTNGIPIPAGCWVNLLDTVQMGQDIAAARVNLATHVLLVLHWGNEYQRTPAPEQRQLAAWAHRQGVFAVIGSHPHVVQPVEVTDGEVTVYSLGNFISNQRQLHTDGGIGVCITLCETAPNYPGSYHPPFSAASQAPTPASNYTVRVETLSSWVWNPMEGGRRRYYVLPEYLAGDSLASADEETRRRASFFFEQTRTLLGDSIQTMESPDKKRNQFIYPTD